MTASKLLLLAKAKKKATLKKLLLLRLKLQIRTRNAVTNECLATPYESSWMRVYTRGTNENLIALTSLDRASFEHLLLSFKEQFHIHSCTLRGRPSKFQFHHQALGLILVHYCDTIGVFNYIIANLHLANTCCFQVQRICVRYLAFLQLH